MPYTNYLNMVTSGCLRIRASIFLNLRGDAGILDAIGETNAADRL